MAHRRAGLRSLGMTIGAVLADLPAADPAETRLTDRWADAVGADWAKHSNVVRLESGVLSVAVDSPVRRYEWSMQKDKLRDSLNRFLGNDIIREVQVTMRTTRGR